MVSNIKDFLWLLLISMKQILRIDLVRFLICYLRFIYFYKIRKYFKTFYPIGYKSESIPGHSKSGIGTIEYNACYIKEKKFFEMYNQFSGYRSQRLVTFLAMCFSGMEGLRNKKCLSIGPRTEAEIFSLMSYGAKSSDIKALDLHTYSPKIVPADITNIPFDSNFFDCIIAGWVLPYVADKQKAADEIIRVSKDGALIAISHSWYPENDQLSNGDFTNGQRIVNNDKIIKFFSKHIKCILVDFDQSKFDCTEKGDLISIFKIKKDL